jgi:hypothetical protein
MCLPGTSTPLRQPNAPQAGAQCPPGRWLTRLLFDFSMRQPLVQTFPSVQHSEVISVIQRKQRADARLAC